MDLLHSSPTYCLPWQGQTKYHLQTECSSSLLGDDATRLTIRNVKIEISFKKQNRGSF